MSWLGTLQAQQHPWLCTRARSNAGRNAKLSPKVVDNLRQFKNLNLMKVRKRGEMLGYPALDCEGWEDILGTSTSLLYAGARSSGHVCVVGAARGLCGVI